MFNKKHCTKCDWWLTFNQPGNLKTVGKIPRKQTFYLLSTTSSTTIQEMPNTCLTKLYTFTRTMNEPTYATSVAPIYAVTFLNEFHQEISSGISQTRAHPMIHRNASYMRVRSLNVRRTAHAKLYLSRFSCAECACSRSIRGTGSLCDGTTTETRSRCVIVWQYLHNCPAGSCNYLCNFLYEPIWVLYYGVSIESSAAELAFTV